MATLNSSETESLRNVQRVLDAVLRDGYTPGSEEPNEVLMSKLLKQSKSSVSTIVSMKGYFPS